MNAESVKEFKRYTPDELRELYKKDPEHFDALAAAVLAEACIGSSEEQTMKLRQLQWFIDGQLRKGKTPLQRLQIMENIFYSRVFGDDGELAQLSSSCHKLLNAVTVTDKVPARKPALYLLKRSGGVDEITGTA